MDFKIRLKKLRKENNMTQKELGDYLSYGSSAISNYEKGINFPSITYLIKIAKPII